MKIQFKDVENAITHFISVYEKKGIPKAKINNGYCEDFAADVIEYLGGYKKSGIQELSAENFMIGENGSEYDNDIWDVQLLKRYWPKIIPPNGCTWDDINDLDFTCHIWMEFKGKHFDATCSQGKYNIFDMPFFIQRKKDCEKYNKKFKNTLISSLTKLY